MDYILMPKWITDISDIHSKLVRELLQDTDIIGNTIDMQLIREYYMKYPNKFNLLISELSLRGFTFFYTKPNNVLPKYRLLDDEEFILSMENKNLYRNIDFEVFNLGNFLSRFEVKDDRFFNLIPLRGFEFLNPAIDIQRLKENLLQCGFEICKSSQQPDGDSKLIEEVIGLLNTIGHKRALIYILSITKDSIYDDSQPSRYDKVIIREDIYEIFKEVCLRDIGRLYLIKIPKQILDLKLKDINGRRYGEIYVEHNFNEVGNMLEGLNSIMLPQVMLNMFMSDKKNKVALDILDLRFRQGKTLKEVGLIYKVTRERIRQRQNNTLGEINTVFSTAKVVEILKILNPGKKFFTKEQIIRLLGQSNANLINIFSHNEINGLNYWEELKIFSFESKEFFQKANDGLISILPEIYRSEDYFELISSYLYDILAEELTSEVILNLLNSIGYTSYGKFFSINRLSIIDILEIVFKYYIDEPLLMDEEGYEKISRILKKELNYSYKSSLRAIEARIRDVENIILTDNKTFFHISKIDYNEELMQEIESYLEDVEKERNIINIEIIYNTFYDKLGELKKYSKLALYSLLGIYLGDKYKVGEGNTLDIYLDKESKKISREEMIIEYLKEHGGIVNKKDILAEFKWKQMRLDDAVSKSKRIISWGRDKIKLVEDIVISIDIKEQFSKILSELMKDGFTTSKLILEESVFYGNLGEFIEKNDLNDKYRINGFLKCMFENLRGNNIFLYDKDSKYLNITEVVCNKFAEDINRAELSSFMEKLGYETMIANSMFDDLISTGKFVEISNTEAVPRDKFIVDNGFILELISVINTRMGDREYISLSDLEGIRKDLPKVDFRVNANFYKSILVQNGFKTVVKYNGDYRYDKVIVVRETSDIDTFEDLVYHILKTEYNGDMHESRIYDFLTDRGIVSEREFLMEKKLPIGVYKHDNIKIDALGFVELVRGEEQESV